PFPRSTFHHTLNSAVAIASNGIPIGSDRARSLVKRSKPSVCEPVLIGIRCTGRPRWLGHGLTAARPGGHAPASGAVVPGSIDFFFALPDDERLRQTVREGTEVEAGAWND